MFYVYCDDTKIYDQNTEDLVLIDPVLQLELNAPGNFQFTMPTSHPYFDLPQKMLSRIWVVQDDTEIFRGRVIEESVDFYKRKTFYCEGELAFLNDSIQRPAEYHNLSVRDYFKTLIDCHNEQVEEDKQFEIGIVLISDDNDSVYRYTNYNSTMEEMEEDLIDDFGGYIRVRNENGHRYLDYIDIDSYGARNDNAIRFGTNLLDYTQDVDVSEIATVIIPLGERLDDSPIEALDMRLTIESVNGGSDAIESEEAVKTYGRIEQTVIWDDVTVASNLLEKGKKYLSDYQFENMVLEVSAVDLHLIDVDVESAHLGDMLRVISTPHGLDRYFPLSQMTIYLDQPDQNLYVLGSYTTEKTLTARVVGTSASIAEVEEEITPTQVILNQAKEQATNLITAATHGYVVMQPNDSPNEILIMDTADTTTAKRLWRWNLNGLGYSSNGYNGSYGTAITMDGAIVADYITTGTLTANVIRAGTLQDVAKNNSWNLDSGELTTKNITATGGTIGGWNITSTRIRSSSSVSIGGSTAGLLLINEPSDKKPFINAQDGKGNTTFQVDYDGSATFAGKLSAATGTFSGSLSAATGTFSGSLSAATGTFTAIYTNSHSSYSSTSSGMWAGTSGISVGSKFSVNSSGTMTAKDATLSGTLSCGSGSLTTDISSGCIQFSYNGSQRGYIAPLNSDYLYIADPKGICFLTPEICIGDYRTLSQMKADTVQIVGLNGLTGTSSSPSFTKGFCTGI